MKIFYSLTALLFLFLFINENTAQVPIQFYDFEVNLNRTLAETTAEILVNNVSGSAITSVGGILVRADGNPSSGSAWQRNDWDENGLFNPGVNALDYIEFNTNTDGFSGVSVSIDALGSTSFQAQGNINLLFSTNGGNTFSQATPRRISGFFTTFVWDLSGNTTLDNNNNIKFRLYGYGDVTAIGNGTLRFDNLYVSAKKVISSKTLGDYQLIDNANGGSSYPVFNDFAIDGEDISVTLQSDLKFSGTLTLTNGIIITNSSKVVMEPGSQVINANIQSYVVGGIAFVYNGSATRIYPTGTLASYRPITLSLNNITGSGAVTITQIEENPLPVSLPSTVQNLSTIRFWRLAKESSLTSLGQMALGIEWAGNDGVTDLNNVTIVGGTAGGNWTFEDNSGGFGGTSTSGFVTGNFFPGQTGDYTLGNLKGGSNPLPVELSAFNAKVIKNNIHLSWQTTTEVNSFKFIIERMFSENMEWREIGEVAASGNSNSPKFYSFTDENLNGGFYSYRLRMIDNDGSFEYSDELHLEINLADDFELSQNYPNPFNPSTVITYKLPEKTFVSLKIYNVLGNEITTLIQEEKPAGLHRIQFDVSDLKHELSNGTYFYHLKAGDYTETKKMIYMK